MRFVERASDLYDVAEHLVQRQRALLQAAGERLALPVLHDDEVDARVATNVVNGADVGMVERCDGFRFALEGGTRVSIARCVRRQHFDRHSAIESCVACTIDLAQAAGAEGGEVSYGPRRAPAAKVMKSASSAVALIVVAWALTAMGKPRENRHYSGRSQSRRANCLFSKRSPKNLRDLSALIVQRTGQEAPMRTTVVASIIALTMAVGGGVAMAAQLGGVVNATKHAGQTTKDAGKAVVHTTKKTASTAGTETKKAVGTAGTETKKAATKAKNATTGVKCADRTHQSAKTGCAHHGGIAK